MKTFFENKKNIAIFAILIGLLGLLSFVFVLYKWTSPDSYFLKYPGIKIVIGQNVVSKAANFLYLTYQSVLLISFWLLLFGISILAKQKKIYFFITKTSITAFVTALGLMIAVFYGSYQLFSGIFYGLNDPDNIIEPAFVFVTSLFHHLILPIIMTVFFFKVKTTGTVKLHNYISMAAYGIIYIMVIEIVGRYAVHGFQWFPYPIFEVSTFAKSFFLEAAPYGFQVFMLVLVLLFAISSLGVFVYIISKIKNKHVSNYVSYFDNSFQSANK